MLLQSESFKGSLGASALQLFLWMIGFAGMGRSAQGRLL